MAEKKVAGASDHLLASWMTLRRASWMKVETFDAFWMETEIFHVSGHLHSSSWAETDVYLSCLQEMLTSASASESEKKSVSEIESLSGSLSGSEMNHCLMKTSECSAH